MHVLRNNHSMAARKAKKSGDTQLRVMYPMMLRDVLEVLYLELAKHEKPRYLTASEICRRIGIVSPRQYEEAGHHRQARRVQMARLRVHRLLKELVRIGWLHVFSNVKQSFKLLDYAARLHVSVCSHAEQQTQEIASALGGSCRLGTNVYFDLEAVPRAHTLLRNAGLLPDDSDTVTLRLAEAQAEALVGQLSQTEPTQAMLAMLLEAALARKAAVRLGERACVACGGAGRISHQDRAGWHTWQCVRCTGAGTEPASPPPGSTKEQQRAHWGYLCSPECHGMYVVLTPHAWRVPAGWVELQRCDTCNVLQNDAEAALEVGGAAARWIDMATGHSHRIDGAWSEQRDVVCVVPVEAAEARGLAIPPGALIPDGR